MYLSDRIFNLLYFNKKYPIPGLWVRLDETEMIVLHPALGEKRLKRALGYERQVFALDRKDING